MGATVIWAEATSCQLEFKYLAKLTGRKEYYERVSISYSEGVLKSQELLQVEHVMELMYQAKPKDGLFTDKWTADGKPFGGKFRPVPFTFSSYPQLILTSVSVHFSPPYCRSFSRQRI